MTVVKQKVIASCLFLVWGVDCSDASNILSGEVSSV